MGSWSQGRRGGADSSPTKALAEVSSGLTARATTFVESVKLWPSGVVSGVGSVMIAAALTVQVLPGVHLAISEFLTTVVVGGVLTLAGPLTASLQIGAAGRSAQRITDAELEALRLKIEEKLRRTGQADGGNGMGYKPVPGERSSPAGKAT